MCLLVVAYRQVPGCPLVVAANRDESLARPSAPPEIRLTPQGTRWLGGSDLTAGGTWLGVNRFGLLVAVTNRTKTIVPTDPVSRGLLCRDFLDCPTADAALEALQTRLQSASFAGFNVALLSGPKSIVVEAADEIIIHALSPGIHAITNGRLNDSHDARLRRALAEFERTKASAGSTSDWMADATRICALEAQNGETPLCIDTAPWGTVSSTVLARTDSPRDARYLFSPGPPSRVAYEDYSNPMRKLLQGDDSQESTSETTAARESNPNQNAAQPHRMHLKGPWQYEWLSRTPAPRGGTIDRTLPTSGKAKMPASWQDLFGAQSGHIRFRRRFHRPTNLDPQERVFLVLDGVGGLAHVTINDHLLGTVTAPRSKAAFDMTQQLQETNVLSVEILFDTTTDGSPGGLWGPVALEIRTD